MAFTTWLNLGKAPTPSTPPLKVRIALSSAFSSLLIIQWAYNPPSGGIALALSLMQGTLLASTSILPLSSSVALIVIDGLTTVCSNGTGPTSTFSVLYALGLLSYMTSDRMAAMLTITMILLQVVYTGLPNGWNVDLFVFVSFIPFSVMASLVGRSLRWREDGFLRQMKLAQAEDNLRQAEFTAHAAQRMHDAVTGELSLIARMAQHHIRAGSNDIDDWRQINESVLNALDNTHKVVDSLNEWGQGVHGTTSSEMETFANRLHRVLDDNDRRINRLGFEGRSVLNIDDGPAPMSEERMTLCTGFIGELYANIIRHAKRESYEVSVVWNDSGIEITTSNALSDEERPQHGQGMQYYRREIERISGTFVTGQLNDGTWYSFAAIPPQSRGRDQQS